MRRLALIGVVDKAGPSPENAGAFKGVPQDDAEAMVAEAQRLTREWMTMHQR